MRPPPLLALPSTTPLLPPCTGDREDTLVEMSFYVPKENEDFGKPAAAAEGADGAEDGEAVAAAAPAKVLFDLVSQFTDAGGWGRLWLVDVVLRIHSFAELAGAAAGAGAGPACLLGHSPLWTGLPSHPVHPLPFACALAHHLQGLPLGTRLPPLTRSACWCRAGASTSRCTCQLSSWLAR